jgi:predicted SAM-dependent methyltransferase
VKLNLGSGDDRREGYVNVDLRDGVADTVCDVRQLPFDDESVEEVLAFDILEHLSPNSTMRALQEWHRVLAPGGTLVVKVPNMRMLCDWVANGYRTSLTNIYGGHRWGPEGSWDAHHTGWTSEMLQDVLAIAGFDQLSNDGALNMTIVAKKV